MSKLVKVHVYKQSEPVVIENVYNTYQKGKLFCVQKGDRRTVYKFPLEHIFRITEIDSEDTSESGPSNREKALRLIKGK